MNMISPRDFQRRQHLLNLLYMFTRPVTKSHPTELCSSQLFFFSAFGTGVRMMISKRNF